jgi:Transglycosylase-like domain
MQPSNDDEHFWARLPDHRWLLQWAGWPKRKPLHAKGHKGWRRRLGGFSLCAIFALSVTFVSFYQFPSHRVTHELRSLAFSRAATVLALSISQKLLAAIPASPTYPLDMSTHLLDAGDPVSTPTPTTADAPAAVAVSAPAPTPSPSDATSTNTPDWACIREHESRDNYEDPGGGAYQFENSTWTSTTGLPGPAEDYPPAAQDAAALELYNERGWEPWTTRFACGL